MGEAPGTFPSPLLAAGPEDAPQNTVNMHGRISYGPRLKPFRLSKNKLPNTYKKQNLYGKFETQRTRNHYHGGPFVWRCRVLACGLPSPPRLLLSRTVPTSHPVEGVSRSSVSPSRPECFSRRCVNSRITASNDCRTECLEPFPSVWVSLQRDLRSHCSKAVNFIHLLM